MSSTPLRKILSSPSSWIMFAAVVACVGLVLYAWRLPPFANGVELTEDAYVRGQVTIIAPKVDGYVDQVLVQDYMPVQAGQVLVQLDDRIYRQRLEQARSALAAQEANLANTLQARRARAAGVGSSQAQIANANAQMANAQAQLARTQADMARATPLVQDGSLSQREFDQTQAALRQAEAAVKQAEAVHQQAVAGESVAQQDLQTVVVNRDAVQAQVESARAAVRLAEIDLEHTRIIAPRDGRAGEIGVKFGQYVTPGTQLLAVVPDTVWVIANFKEAQTAYMAPGQAAHLRVDALDHARLDGRVERISPATGSEFSVIKQDNATGNFTKIPQRLSVRIGVDARQALAARLKPGMSVVVSVDTRRGGRRGGDDAPRADFSPDAAAFQAGTIAGTERRP